MVFRACDLCVEPSHFDSLDALTTHKRLYHPTIPFNRDVQSAHRTPGDAQAEALPPVHLPAGERWGHLTVDGILRTEHMVEISLRSDVGICSQSGLFVYNAILV